MIYCQHSYINSTLLLFPLIHFLTHSLTHAPLSLCPHLSLYPFLLSLSLSLRSSELPRTGTELTRVTDTDIYYSTFFFDIAFNEDDIDEDMNYDSDYEESMMLSAAHLERVEGEAGEVT